MNTTPSLFKQPSAFLPLIMSGAALALLVGHVLIFGITRDTDEGAATHTFQLLMAGQLPFIMYFAVRWLFIQPKSALLILTAQFFAGLLPFTILWFLEHP